MAFWGQVHIVYGGATPRPGLPVLGPLGSGDFGRRVVGAGDIHDEGLPAFAVVAVRDSAHRQNVRAYLARFEASQTVTIPPTASPVLVSEARAGVLADSGFGVADPTQQGGGFLCLIGTTQREIVWICPRCTLSGRALPVVDSTERETFFGPVVRPGDLRGEGRDAVTVAMLPVDPTTPRMGLRIDTYRPTQTPSRYRAIGLSSSGTGSALALGSLLQ